MQRQPDIRQEQIHVEIVACPHAVAGGAGTVPTVEGEQAGIKVCEAQITSRAEEFETVQVLGLPWRQHSARPLPEVYSTLHQSLDSAATAPGDFGRPNHEIDVVFTVTIKGRTSRDSDHSAIEAHMRHTDLRRLREYLLMKTLTAAHNRGENRHLLVRIRGAQVRQDLLGGLRGNLQVTLRAVLHADFGIEQAQIMIHLGHRGDRRLAAATGDTLLNGHSRGDASYDINVRPAQGL